MAALLLLSVAVQIWVVTTKRIPLSSDQAIVCLMAKHILERGEHPVFYYGSAYAGSLEPHYVAGVFLLLGETPTSYRIAMGGLVLLIMTGVYILTREAFGRLAGILALAYLAIPPFYFLYKGLTSDGHYDAFLLFTVAVLLLCVRIEKELGKGRDLRRLALLLGVAMGLGWWINPITPAISAAAVAWLVLRKQPRPPARSALPAAVGFLVGSAPWTVWNLRHEWASLATPELGAVDVEGALHNLSEALRHSVPLLAGGARMRIESDWNVFPFSSLLVGLVLVVLLLPPFRHLLRGDRLTRLFFLGFFVLLATVVWSKRYVPNEPRVLFPYYVLVPPLLAAGLESWTRSGFRALALACGGVLLFVHVFSIAAAHQHLGNTSGEATASLDRLERTLRQNRVRHVYTDYWTAYRLSFESDEEIVAAPIPGEEAVRYPPYQNEVRTDPSAAVVVRGDRDGCLDAYLREQGSPYRRIAAPPFGVFTRLPARVLQFIAEGKGMPLPRKAYRVNWRIGPHPNRLTPGATAPATVTFQNAGPCTWPTAVHVGYHWKSLEAGVPDVPDGGRGVPGRRIAPGEAVTMSLSLQAPQRPGRYLLEYDLVFEQVEWFESRGSVPVKVPMEVR